MADAVRKGLLAHLCAEAEAFDNGTDDPSELCLRRTFCQEILLSSCCKAVDVLEQESLSFYKNES